MELNSSKQINNDEYFPVGTTNINCLDFALENSQNDSLSKINLIILKDSQKKKKFHFLVKKNKETMESVRNKIYKSTLKHGVIPELKNEVPILNLPVNKKIRVLTS